MGICMHKFSELVVKCVCGVSFSVTKIVEIMAQMNKNNTESVKEYLTRIDGEFL